MKRALDGLQKGWLLSNAMQYFTLAFAILVNNLEWNLSQGTFWICVLKTTLDDVYREKASFWMDWNKFRVLLL